MALFDLAFYYPLLGRVFSKHPGSPSFDVLAGNEVAIVPGFPEMEPSTDLLQYRDQSGNRTTLLIDTRRYCPVS